MKANGTGHETKGVVWRLRSPNEGSCGLKESMSASILDKNAQCGGHRELKFVLRKTCAGLMSTAAVAFRIDRRERLTPELRGWRVCVRVNRTVSISLCGCFWIAKGDQVNQ